MTSVIVVLGGFNDADGVLGSLAVARCDATLAEYRSRPGSKILPTGGFGPHFNVAELPHAEYVTRYLVERGIPSTDILAPVLSATTIEDAQMCAPVLRELRPERIVVVTSDFHVERARLLFTAALAEMDLEFVPGVPSPAEPAELQARLDNERRRLAELKRDGPPR